MANIGKEEIEELVKISEVTGFAGNYKELGGGEINDTFRLECDPEPIILRVSKYEDQKSLPREARALASIDHPRVPSLIFFDKEERIKGRHWIMESYIPGEQVDRLSPAQFKSLGSLLAEVHLAQSSEVKKKLWEELMKNCSSFGDEDFHLNHPYPKLQALVLKMKEYCADWQPKVEEVTSVLVHGDVTPSNILVQGDEAALIDWELTSFRDGLSEFATLYYDDIEYNQGKWRIKITSEEKQALFEGYEAAGGVIDQERVNLWMNHDKMGAALFLYWRIHDSGRPATDEQMAQYQLDLDNLIGSLERNLD